MMALPTWQLLMLICSVIHAAYLLPGVFSNKSISHNIVLMYSKPIKHLDAAKILAKGLIWLFIDAATKRATISHH